MAKMTEKELIAGDKRRNIGAELLQAVRQMKAGKARRVHLKRWKHGCALGRWKINGAR